ncbi:hypothetical protein GCM10010345_59560 [Streptomyces canarius]|uniref:Uncharacterized protein n=1 Tax=Streptomyces canarius TaxID=285453 RepID=A0ABQ3CX36_9ACTN|nr:hypothetical protein GCM10010345_59560 [Streptomyces canarius]
MGPRGEPLLQNLPLLGGNGQHVDLHYAHGTILTHNTPGARLPPPGERVIITGTADGAGAAAGATTSTATAERPGVARVRRRTAVPARPVPAGAAEKPDGVEPVAAFSARPSRSRSRAPAVTEASEKITELTYNPYAPARVS